jgi:hypothetical protein
MKLLITIVIIVTLLAPALNTTVAVAQTPLIIFPSPQVEFIIGPQVKSGTSDLSGAQWFDQNAIDRGLALCSAFPDVAHTPGNALISGTVSVTKGSKIVTGAGTKFLSELRDYAIIENGTGRLVKIVGSVQSDTQLTLTLDWEGSTLSGQTISSPSAAEVDTYQNYQNYYDFGLAQYDNYHRTGDQRFLDCARKVEDSWWSHAWIDNGNRDVTESLAPRSISLNGLMLRALDGRPEMWPWITRFIDYQFHNWVEVPGAGTGLYFGVRDGGFMLLYAANLAAVHPDAVVRADYKQRALSAAVNYYARLQQSDGSYRWNDEGFPFSGSEQPFQVGILNEGMIAVHHLTGDGQVKTAILKSAEHEATKSYNPSGYRAMYYFIHGTIGSPPVNCETGCGSAANPFPPANSSQISEARQLNATLIHLFGYAYAISGDNRFRKWGDEIFDSTYSGKDGFRGLAASGRGKEYDESYRSGGKYLAWRLSGGTTVPTPSPSPSPSPSPTPTLAPTPLPSPAPPTTPCAISAPGSVIIPAWTNGEVNVALSNAVQPVTITATGSSGQVVVVPLTKTISGASVIAAFQLRVKKQSRTIGFQSSCGNVSVSVVVQ